MLLKDVGVRKIGVKMQVAEKYSLACPKTKCGKNVYELEDHIARKH